MIGVSNGHVLRRLRVERKGLKVSVLITTLCGKQGEIKNLDFEIFYPEITGNAELQLAVSACSLCRQLISKPPIEVP